MTSCRIHRKEEGQATYTGTDTFENIMSKAYLDIETSFNGNITVVGILRQGKGFVQLVQDKIILHSIEDALRDMDTICTYNGNKFDLPVIKRELGLDLRQKFKSHDLMYDCWRLNLYGGLKRVEERLGIVRQSKGIDGMEAMRLWQRYERYGDMDSLNRLLFYNREDVENLVVLEQKLQDIQLL